MLDEWTFYRGLHWAPIEKAIQEQIIDKAFDSKGKDVDFADLFWLA